MSLNIQNYFYTRADSTLKYKHFVFLYVELSLFKITEFRVFYCQFWNQWNHVRGKKLSKIALDVTAIITKSL